MKRINWRVTLPAIALAVFAVFAYRGDEKPFIIVMLLMFPPTFFLLGLGIILTWRFDYSGTNYVSGNYGPGWKSPVLTPPSVPASTVELVNPFSYDCYALVLGGTISAIAIGPAGATQVYGATAGLVPVRVGEVIKLTYTVAPTVFNWFAR